MNENIVKAVATKKAPCPIKAPTKIECKAVIPYDLQLEYEHIIKLKIELEKLTLEIKIAESNYNYGLRQYIKSQAER